MDCVHDMNQAEGSRPVSPGLPCQGRLVQGDVAFDWLELPCLTSPPHASPAAVQRQPLDHSDFECPYEVIATDYFQSRTVRY